MVCFEVDYSMIPPDPGVPWLHVLQVSLMLSNPCHTLYIFAQYALNLHACLTQRSHLKYLTCFSFSVGLI